MSFKDKIAELVDKKVNNGMDRVAAIAETADSVGLSVTALAKMLDTGESVTIADRTRASEDWFTNENILKSYRDRRTPEQIRMSESEEDILADNAGF